MYLQSLQVENYRAVRKGELTFDETIAIIGENDSGKSSLLDALDKMLNASFVEHEFKFESRHFYKEVGNKQSSIFFRIILYFEEKKQGEWSQKIYQPIHELFNDSIASKQKLALELKAELTNENKVITKWSIRNIHSNKISNNQETIQWLRSVNPIVMLSAGMLTGHGIEKLPVASTPLEKNAFPEELQSYVKSVQSFSQVLFAGKSLQILADLETAYKAALKLNDYLSKLSGFDGIKFSLTNRLATTKSSKGNADIEKTGSNSEKLGALLVMNALINASNNTALSEVDPIWVLEDPEAHLHKITLASVSNIISGIKGQKIITTNSGGLLASIPIHRVRRLIRNEGVIKEFYVKENALSKDDIRRINYHVRTHRNSAFFSRVWLLVEGETEFWIIPRLARILGYDFRLEGITCVEYAQSGLRPLIKVAEQMNIQWLMLSDGDKAGYKYANQAQGYTTEENRGEKICVVPDRDIEQYLWRSGYDNVYIKHARTRIDKDKLVPSRTIKMAVRNYSKPHLALSVVEAAAENNSPGIPEELVDLIENCVVAARRAVFL